MISQDNFWKFSSVDWEKKRYDSMLSHLIFSSLYYRQNFIAWVISQAPKGFRVVELGCGSGRIFDLLSNKGDIQYTGFDISDSAIHEARLKFKNYPNANWNVASLDAISGLQADLVFSAGLLDWVKDEELQTFLRNNSIPQFIHSFSQDRKNWRTGLHEVFAKILSLADNVAYRPRKFQNNHLQNLFNVGNIHFTTHAKLSFGAFIHNLTPEFNAKFESFLTYLYFKNKGGDANAIERFFKNIEAEKLEFLWQKAAGLKVLEIGSGYGFYTKKILAQKPESLDCIDSATNTPNFIENKYVRFYSCSFESAPLEKKYDMIFVLGVMEFVSDLNLFVKKIKYICHVNTKIFLLLPNQTGWLRNLYLLYHRRRGHHVLNDELLRLADLLQQNGLKVGDVTALGPLNELLEITHDA